MTIRHRPTRRRTRGATRRPLIAAALALSAVALVGCEPTRSDEPQQQVRTYRPASEGAAPSAPLLGPFTSAGMELCVTRMGEAYRAGTAARGGAIRLVAFQNKTGLDLGSDWEAEFLERLGARWQTAIQAPPHPVDPAVRQLTLTVLRLPDRAEAGRANWQRLAIECQVADAAGRPQWTYRYPFWADGTAIRQAAAQRRTQLAATSADDEPLAVPAEAGPRRSGAATTTAPATQPARRVPPPPPRVRRPASSQPAAAPAALTVVRGGPTTATADSDDDDDAPAPRRGEWVTPAGRAYLLDPRLEGQVEVTSQQALRQGGAFVVRVTLANRSRQPVSVRVFITLLDREGRFVAESAREVQVLQPGEPLTLQMQSADREAVGYACGIDRAAR